MKLIKVAVAAALALSWGSAYAFHSGGVAECEGCHSMHNSLENAPNVTGMPQFQSGPYLLKAQDQSGACLNCHNAADVKPSSYHISTDGSLVGQALQGPIEATPGGDFAWLKMTTTGSIRKTLTTWHGERKGHNIVAVDFGYVADAELTAAPGGTYPAANLACSSCHDPHGRFRRFADGSQATTGLPIFNSGSYTSSADPIANVSAVGVYRILGGVGYQPKSLSGSFAFANKAPDAVAKSTYNGVSTTTTTAAGQVDLVAYGNGSSEWCANCHTAILQNGYASGVAMQRHPAGNDSKLTAAIAANYNAYISSGIMTGTGGTFSALAPFEIGTADYTALKAFPGAPSDAGTTNNVSCLSCHRAHATAFESMTRFYRGNEFMTVADASNAAIYDSSTTENKINMGLTQAQQQNAYNGRPATVFGPYARNYCNKCHAKD